MTGYVAQFSRLSYREGSVVDVAASDSCRIVLVVIHYISGHMK